MIDKGFNSLLHNFGLALYLYFLYNNKNAKANFMKFLLPLLFSLGLFAAQSGVYVELNLDNPSSSDLKIEDSQYNYDKGLSGTVALGYQMERWRFELESNYSKNELSNSASDIIKTGGLANVYYSAYNHTKMVSTIGLGVGATEIQSVDDTQTQKLSKSPALTYQGTVSLGYMVGEDWTWTIKYRYLDMQDVEIENQTFSLGLRYLF